jgi:hypothetical protein
VEGGERIDESMDDAVGCLFFMGVAPLSRFLHFGRLVRIMLLEKASIDLFCQNSCRWPMWY